MPRMKGNNYKSSNAGMAEKFRKKVLILDVDNTLYSEEELIASTGSGIEQQIIKNTHKFGQKYLNLTAQMCDDLYLSHGSTIDGMRHLLVEKDHDQEYINQFEHKFYDEVYSDIDMACLTPSETHSAGNTGYNHSRVKRHVIRDLLENMKHPIYFASNSPKAHVIKVLSALGLNNVKHEGFITPDTANGGYLHSPMTFPTKSDPKVFFHHLLERFDPDELVLVDDSENNLKYAENALGIVGLQVNKGAMNLETALNAFLGHIELKQLHGQDAYEFDCVKYLQGKNEVDAVAINPSVWRKLSRELLNNLGRDSKLLRIVDVGAGLLSMLVLILDGGGGKESLIDQLSPGTKLEYIAYESNDDLFDACKERLRNMGFETKDNGNSRDEHIFKKKLSKRDDISIKVLLRVKDFSEDTLSSSERPHLIIGCCFADLFHPDELTSTLLRFTARCGLSAGGEHAQRLGEILVYFPITFDGTTQFLPPGPFALNGNSIVPSDTVAFQLYADSLVQNYNHNLDPNKIINAMNGIGATLITSGTAIWNIDPNENEYLWNTMLYFFGCSAAPQILNRGWDSFGWMSRARKSRSIIRVRNQDLLFTLPQVDSGPINYGSSRDSDACEINSDTFAEEIEFQKPNVVGKKTKVWNADHLGPGQIEVKSVCSLISSGTELKIFKGLFDDAALDVNIKGMAEESMKYPLAYGYSLVGIVTRCATDVTDAEDIIGKMVFTFSPHASHVVVDRDSVHIVPEGIAAEDAIFMPSVETALSLTHDANVRIGENVAVYGQGLIGLLVNAILSRQQMNMSSGNFGSLTVFDTIGDRLAMASTMGASQALMPSEASEAGPFDVAIEVSGNFRALQSAIDSTRNGGRVIVGSWYGNTVSPLKLGIDFHRSHKTIKTSQVSNISAELSTLWSKDRRFALTWDLVRLLRPSILISKRTTLDSAQEAYDLLDEGSEIVIVFTYA